MQTLDYVSGLHNCLEFSQPSSCLDEAMLTRKKGALLVKWFIAFNLELIRQSGSCNFQLFEKLPNAN